MWTLSFLEHLPSESNLLISSSKRKDHVMILGVPILQTAVPIIVRSNTEVCAAFGSWSGAIIKNAVCAVGFKYKTKSTTPPNLLMRLLEDHLIYYLVPHEQTSGKQRINTCNCCAEPLWPSWHDCRLHGPAFHLSLPTLAEQHYMTELGVHHPPSPLFISKWYASQVDKLEFLSLLYCVTLGKYFLLSGPIGLYSKLLTYFYTRIICRNMVKCVVSVWVMLSNI